MRLRLKRGANWLFYRNGNCAATVIKPFGFVGSMGTSVIYSGIFGSVMGSIPAIQTKMVVFDAAVADLTEELQDPVDLLFGVQLIMLLALNDDGAPSYDHSNAQILSDMGVPVFACTPNMFPDMMAAALSKQDLALWAAGNDIALKKG